MDTAALAVDSEAEEPAEVIVMFNPEGSNVIAVGPVNPEPYATNMSIPATSIEAVLLVESDTAEEIAARTNAIAIFRYSLLHYEY
ncbi:MAG TPA: hypothetical protein VFI61_02255 [Patescibacteria group bacterium]|nr:hypothetical protein [Patescibacteria group bacterium]